MLHTGASRCCWAARLLLDRSPQTHRPLASDAHLCPQVQALLGNALERLHGWLAGETGIKHPPSMQVGGVEECTWRP